MSNAAAPPPRSPPHRTAPRRAVEGLLQDYAAGDYRAMRARLAPDFRWTHRPTPHYAEGLSGDAQALLDMYAPSRGGAFVMVDQRIEEILIAGPRVVVRIVNRFRFADAPETLREVRGALFFETDGARVRTMDAFYAAPINIAPRPLEASP